MLLSVVFPAHFIFSHTFANFPSITHFHFCRHREVLEGSRSFSQCGFGTVVDDEGIRMMNVLGGQDKKDVTEREHQIDNEKLMLIL